MKPSDLKIFWACPVYKEPHPLYVEFMNLARRHFGDADRDPAGRLAVRHLVGESCLSRARATLYAEFRRYQQPWTHFLSTDDDQSVFPAHLEELAALGYPVSGFPVAYKADPPHKAAGATTVRALEGEEVAPDGTLRVKYLGGFVLWRADVLQALEALHPELGFDTNPPDGERLPTFDFWNEFVRHREKLSEDYASCQLAEDAGFEVRAQTRFCAPHWVGERSVDWTDPASVEAARLTWKAYVPTGYEAPGTPQVRLPGQPQRAAA